MGDGCEDIGTMCCAAFDAISVVYTTLSCLVVNIEILKIVVKVDRACAEITAEKGSMCGEYSSNVNVSFSTKRDSNTGLPLMKVGDNCSG
jgi:hypothetical protein